MMHVVLVNPPTLFRWKPLTYHHFNAEVEPYYRRILGRAMQSGPTLPGEHLGLQSLAAALRATGQQVTLLNACVELHSTLRQTVEAVERLEADVIGFTGPADVYGEIDFIVRELRRRGYSGRVVLGNDHATLNYRAIMQSVAGIDAVFRGESEDAIVRYVQALAGDGALAGVPGLVWRRGGELVVNPPGHPLDLNTLTPPARDDLTSVLALGMSGSIFAGRGCLYRCSFCTTGAVAASVGPKGGAMWRKKDSTQVAAEMLALVDAYGLQHVTVVDDLFLAKDEASHEWAREFAAALQEGGNTASFMIDCRVDSIRRDTFAELKAAGLARVFVGAESGSQGALRSLNKNYGGASTLDRLDVLQDLELEAILGFINFTPYETTEGLRQSAALLRSCGFPDYELFLQEVRVYPGTSLEKQLNLDGLIRGSFPIPTFEYQDPEVAAIAARVTELGSTVRHAVNCIDQLEKSAMNAIFYGFAGLIEALSERDLQRANGSEAEILRLVDAIIKEGLSC